MQDNKDTVPGGKIKVTKMQPMAMHLCLKTQNLQVNIVINDQKERNVFTLISGKERSDFVFSTQIISDNVYIHELTSLQLIT